jgi:hypothetical protein
MLHIHTVIPWKCQIVLPLLLTVHQRLQLRGVTQVCKQAFVCVCEIPIETYVFSKVELLYVYSETEISELVLTTDDRSVVELFNNYGPFRRLF